MNHRKLANQSVVEIGLGAMNLSHAYGTPPEPAAAKALLHAALDLGINHIDTAALYGFGRNEELVGETLQPFRQRFFLASKCGMTGVNGKRVIDGRPETLKQTCKEALRRLRTDVIDLYYLHRWDKKVPVEDSVGGLADLVREGHIRAIGLSEVSAQTLRKAHAVHPIAAVQSEYSLWTRNPEIGLLTVCRELGTALVAFSPLARGFLANGVPDPRDFVEKDIRRGMPRFHPPHFGRNRKLLDQFNRIAWEAGCTPAQLALAWLLAKAPFVLPIVGTTSIAHLEEDIAASKVRLSADTLAALEKLINADTVSGSRYPPETLAEIDTEETPNAG
ncbi:aldo/keto reductase [Steroidobacter agaridevorans]|uniref:aldo/keto reductase n=1 Tax=Steroidobacter agaridevorans TaxID=2695856 RepID=UPI001323B9DC|nr:aldo/keto reductase [Steroidobacter agaridevorans]GFE85331.1 oxidoreductase [Steroidobacter agaridevorans]